MLTAANSASPSLRNALYPIVCAGLLTGVTDGLFSSILSVAFYGSSVARLFQGVASVLIGPDALQGGTPMMLLGILMHFGVAFAWSAVFSMVVMRASRIRNLLATPYGPAAIAAVYGPLIWMSMSLVLIPLLTQHAPAITVRWWIQWFGHIPFVGLPIVAGTKFFRRPRL